MRNKTKGKKQLKRKSQTDPKTKLNRSFAKKGKLNNKRKKIVNMQLIS